MLDKTKISKYSIFDIKINDELDENPDKKLIKLSYWWDLILGLSFKETCFIKHKEDFFDGYNIKLLIDFINYLDSLIEDNYITVKKFFNKVHSRQLCTLCSSTISFPIISYYSYDSSFMSNIAEFFHQYGNIDESFKCFYIDEKSNKEEVFKNSYLGIKLIRKDDVRYICRNYIDYIDNLSKKYSINFNEKIVNMISKDPIYFIYPMFFSYSPSQFIFIMINSYICGDIFIEALGEDEGRTSIRINNKNIKIIKEFGFDNVLDYVFDLAFALNKDGDIRTFLYQVYHVFIYQYTESNLRNRPEYFKCRDLIEKKAKKMRNKVNNLLIDKIFKYINNKNTVKILDRCFSYYDSCDHTIRFKDNFKKRFEELDKNSKNYLKIKQIYFNYILHD